MGGRGVGVQTSLPSTGSGGVPDAKRKNNAKQTNRQQHSEPALGRTRGDKRHPWCAQAELFWGHKRLLHGFAQGRVRAEGGAVGGGLDSGGGGV